MGKEAIHPPSETGGEAERKGVKRDAWRKNGEKTRHLSCVSRIDHSPEYFAVIKNYAYKNICHEEGLICY